MRAARWVVVGAALLAAAVAFYLLLGPGRLLNPGRRLDPGRLPSPGRSTGAGTSSRPVTIPKGSGSRGAPQEEIDPESRDAMRDFLRQSLGDEGSRGPGGRDERERPTAR
ncbi:MAG: hypothetical protein R3F35_01500 [Myxococcota bacterium]